ncbi:Asp-tRNA(Asn)/Glu-tRNA(Gln) amidotransferase subunit GatA [Aureliella helgolandensis]|uniref:Glutamyl-tRNA(Gln) amidotransferase subunit A n=1 Tax=Aureliella helgolandensis TaxID=2527968 RepID=A0A518GH55_9BACT|nr:Asp-tRNA(Asn)/Glu-tRNA(Gln) amidotransferase subunit GatA [Aureliella helgolandensis]QDV27922.1 Glutamyl-tRNA(Gln) amidotransferase subunit A [Aureliella helgolandensis]
MKLELLSAVELGRKIAAREISSREATTYFLDRVDFLDARVNAFVHVGRESALALSDQVDQALSSGQVASPLAGVPVALKDVLCTDSMPTTCGSRMLEKFQPPYTATSVANLLQAGLIPLGKTNMDEFAMGGSTETSFSGATRNPWSLERTPGGSSGGASACLAAGMAPLSIGSDTGGSVRQPAAFCGVCGLKPTYGRISRYGLVAFASSLDQVGPLAHTVEDLAASLQLLAGHDSRDSTSLNEAVPDYSAELERPLAGLRVGVIREHLEHPSLDAEVRQAVLRGQQMLKDLGATILDVTLPHTEYSVPTYYLVAPSEASGNLSRYDGVHYGFREKAENAEGSQLEAMIARSRSQGFGAEVKRRIMLGTFALSAGYYDAYYKKALQVRRLIADDYRQAFGSVDVLLGPVTPRPAFGLGENMSDPVQMYLEDLFTVGANLAGIPAISLPAGFSEGGLPLAIQLHAPALGEARLLNVAYQIQQARFFEPKIAELS